MTTRRNFRGPCAFGRKRGHHREDPTFRAVLDAVAPDDPEYEPFPRRDSAEPLTKVYFVLDREAAQVKIGLTENVEHRLAQLSRTRGRPLELLAAVPGGYNLERAMHGRFREFRAEGREWYRSEIVGELPAIVAS